LFFHFTLFFPRYHKKFPPNANIIGFLHIHIITYLAKFGWNYLEKYLLFRAALTGISWDKKQRVKKRWFLPPIIKEEEVNMTYWLRKKHIEIELLVNLKEWMRWNE
ncbi:hypothetical protein, partial [Caldifermentibacillus hisashii]|uniref:hypothetical protein n=1 Tax=Caldifermentibacillus hisashii TaxID=996558 RepID=UPI0030E7F4DC